MILFLSQLTQATLRPLRLLSLWIPWTPGDFWFVMEQKYMPYDNYDMNYQWDL